MADDMQNEQSRVGGDSGDLTVATAGLVSEISGLVGLPAAVKRDVFRAFGRLLGIPVAWLEGKASEIRANSNAKTAKISAISKAEVGVISATGRAMAHGVSVDANILELANRRAQDAILRQHVNAQNIVSYAAEELRKEPVLDRDDASLSDDWLNIFEREGIEMSSNHMQMLFGRILAGEIKRPGSYSIKAVRTMAQLDNEVATHFRKLSSITSVLDAVPGPRGVGDARVICLWETAKHGGLVPFGFTFDVLSLLQEYGLVISELETAEYYSASIDNSDNMGYRPFVLCGQRYKLVPIGGPMDPVTRAEFSVNGLQLTSVGADLMTVVDVDAEWAAEYLTFLKVNFKERGLELNRPGILRGSWV